MEEVGKEGIKTTLIFGVYRDAVPIDCKIKIMDLEEKTVYHEEFVKKAIYHEDLLKMDKNRIVESKHISDFHSKTNFFKKDNHQIIIEDALELTFRLYSTFISRIHLKAGIFVISFEVDDGYGNKHVAKTIFNKQVDTSNKEMGLLLKELGWL